MILSTAHSHTRDGGCADIFLLLHSCKEGQPSTCDGHRTLPNSSPGMPADNLGGSGEAVTTPKPTGNVCVYTGAQDLRQ